MSKLFSRTKSAATLGKVASNGAYSDTDDFGRVKSIPFKRGKTESALARSRQRTLSNPNLFNASSLANPNRNNTESYYDRPDTPRDLPILPDGLFLSTNVAGEGAGHGYGDDFHPYYQTDQSEATKQEYGYLATERHVVLGLDEVVRLVDVVADELGQRGLTTALLFSPLAIDIRPNVVKKLISSFIATCPHHLALSSTEAKWREEAAFAGPHELAMLLRWGLARIIRLEKGVEMRGFITWESYVLWRQEEHANGYQPNFMSHFIADLDSPVRTLFLSLFHLLTRFAANSSSSGLTPIQIATFFGPLIFGLGNPSFAFSHTYACYLRASHATEHILLAFIRWQESQTQLKGAMPVRLKDWVRGYPSMIPEMGRIEKPRKGAKLTRLSSIRRNVRLYSPDLVRNSASWSVPHGEFQSSKDWARIAPPFLKLTPRFSDTFRKYLNVPPTFHPELGAGSNMSEVTRPLDEDSKSELGLFETSSLVEDEKFRSLTDMRWGTFENFGFSDTDKNKLAFDLTESARKARSEKRETLSWNDFSSAGFSRTDEPLSATLQFSTPVSSSINSWASQSAEIHKKLKKAQKSLPPFGWDTTPVIGREEMIEEGFLETFCSLVYGTGWMDRAEGTFRECNWALVEYKALPAQRPPAPPSGDPRTSSILFLFEEFVPREYREQLAAPKKKGLFAPTALFVASLNARDKKWKPAPTLNGKPYVIGNTPTGTHTGEVGVKTKREAEFEHMLKSTNATTKVSLTRGISTKDHPIPTPLTTHTPLPEDVPPVPPLPNISPVKTKGRFKIKRKKSGGIQPAEYDEMDFETREASDSSDEDLLSPGSGKDKRISRADDAWIDILVADNKRRIPGQDTEVNGGPRRKAGNRSDPDLARQEMAKALAGIPPPTDDDGFPFHHQQQNVEHSQLDAHGHRGYGNPHDRIHIEESLPEPEPYPYSHGLGGRRSLESDEYTQNEGPMIRVQSPSTIASRNEQRWIGTGHHRESTDEGDFEPLPQTLSQEVEIPSFIDTERNYSHELIPPQPTSATLPPSPSPISKNSLPTEQASSDGSPGNRPKVSALIDMYQQKAAPGPSKLPVRTASLDNPKSAAEKSSPVPAPEPIPEPEVVAAPLDLPAGRVSPGRYVHGAPLHNVVEEEEEEEA